MTDQQLYELARSVAYKDCWYRTFDDNQTFKFDYTSYEKACQEVALEVLRRLETISPSS